MSEKVLTGKTALRRILPVMIAVVAIIIIAVIMSSVKSSSPNPEISDKDSSYLTIGQYKVSKEKLYTYLRKNYGVVELARLVDEKLLENENITITNEDTDKYIIEKLFEVEYEKIPVEKTITETFKDWAIGEKDGKPYAKQIDRTIEKVVSVGPQVPEGFEDFHKDWEKAAPFKRPSHANSNDDISLMYFTSGTTGNPKMVAHDFTYPLGHIVTGSFWHNLHQDSLHLTIADTGWGKAVWGKLYGQWIAGATVFVYDHEKFTPADMLQMIQDYRITSLCAPPTIFRFLIREDLTKYDLSSLQYCTIAGEALNPAVYDTFYKLTGIKLMEGFGQTETTLTVATFPWIEPKPGSMGVPNPQYEVDLLRPDGTRAEDGEQGQIVIHTVNGKPIGLFKEYYRDAERTREAWHDGLYYTGDVAWRDEDGYLWFVGRADDVIKSSGYRIGPFEVESALMTHPAVVECAITGVPDEIRGQVVKATIILSKDYKDKAGDALIKELQNHVKKVTAPYKYPRVVEFVDELPKTISGKIRRVEIRNKNK